ncbi:hypothetical protein K438DRAFT_1983415 [Mycena galopus ATCC 62051]|nr:hypothetical protein K438DRAFT_1983415 [Mycena galopus ATCC 62051]
MMWPFPTPFAGPSSAVTPNARGRSPLPPLSPILSSPEHSPSRPATPEPLPPLSSDGLIYTSPIIGTKAERKAKAYSKSQKKKKETLARKALSEEERKRAVFDGVLHELESNGLTFGDLMLYIFNLVYKQGVTRWNRFFRKRGLATSILGFWVAPENSPTAREEVKEWAGDYIATLAQDTAREITASKYLQTGEAPINGDSVDGFRITKLHSYFQQSAQTVMKVLDAFATSARNLRKDLPSRALKRATIVMSAALALLGEYSHKNNISRRIMGLYLYAAGTQRQTIMVMAHLGISESYQNLTRKPCFTVTRRNRHVDLDVAPPPTPPPTPLTSHQTHIAPDASLLAAKIDELRTVRLGTLRQLSDSMRDLARGVAATGLYAASYDNINVPLWKVALEDMSIDELNKVFSTAAPLSIKDVLLSAPELALLDNLLKHCILRIIVDHGGEKFQRFWDTLNESLPETPDKIELHQTPLHPMPAWNIDESTIIGNDKVVDAIHTELRVKESSHWSSAVKFFAGDQL